MYLNPLDQFVNRTLKAPVYVRYVDDFLLFGDSRQRLGEMRERIADFLCGLRLRMHPAKSRVYRTREGVTFLGWRVFPERARLVRDNVIRFRRKLHDLRNEFNAGETEWEDVDMRVRAWIAHAAHGETWRLREHVFGQCAFRRGVRPQAAALGSTTILGTFAALTATGTSPATGTTT